MAARFGSPSATGSSNDLRFADFAGKHRLAFDDGRHVKVYDTGAMSIRGFTSTDGRTLRFDADAPPRRLSSLILV